MRILHWGGGWVAQGVVAGRSAVLQRMFAALDDRAFLVPVVRHVDVFGTDMLTGGPLHERLRR